MGKYFKQANSLKEAVEYWDSSQFELTDIVLALTDHKIDVGLKLYMLFSKQDFLDIMKIFKFNFKQVKEELGIWGEYVERKGDIYSKTFNPKRNPSVLKLELGKLPERAQEIYDEILAELSDLCKKVVAKSQKK